MSLSLKVIGVLILLSLCSVSAYVMGYEDMPLVEAAVRSRVTPQNLYLGGCPPVGKADPTASS